jgi:4-amino-4-deoxy-L-arabinose transferase-like glycosyltransferase
VLGRTARHLAWSSVTLGLSGTFGALAAFNLANYRPVTNDEVELIAVGYKLATQGVLGSDLYVGFFGADRHFFITLPLQHIIDAFGFQLFGAGVTQARGVSVAAGVSIVWLVGWLAYRWYGLAAAVVCELLLVAWPLNLTAASNGLSLLGISRTARYDVLAVAVGWLALVMLDVGLRRPRPSRGLALGTVCGIAALTQFTGSFVLPLVAVNWLWARGRVSGMWWIIVGACLALLPLTVAAALHADDVAGQLTVYAGRGEFLRPDFYAENVTHEAGRYAHLLRPINVSTWMLILGIWPATACVAWRSHRSGSIGDRVVWSSLVIFAGLLLLLDHTKSSIYAVALLPSICLALSRLLTNVPATLWRSHRGSSLVASGVVAAVLVFVLGEGRAAYQLTLEQARQVSPYASVGEQIEQALTPGAHVLGPERWWWALHSHPYLSLRSVWWQWMNAHERAFPDGTSWPDADAVVVNDNVRDDVLHFPESVQQRFWSFVTTCTTRIAALDDETYFSIQVYRVIKPPPDTQPCTLQSNGHVTD